MTEWLHFHFALSCIGEGNGNLFPCSCLENPRDGGSWWASVYGVVQSRTSECSFLPDRVTGPSCFTLRCGFGVGEGGLGQKPPDGSFWEQTIHGPGHSERYSSFLSVQKPGLPLKPPHTWQTSPPRASPAWFPPARQAQGPLCLCPDPWLGPIFPPGL